MAAPRDKAFVCSSLPSSIWCADVFCVEISSGPDHSSGTATTQNLNAWGMYMKQSKSPTLQWCGIARRMAIPVPKWAIKVGSRKPSGINPSINWRDRDGLDSCMTPAFSVLHHAANHWLHEAAKSLSAGDRQPSRPDKPALRASLLKRS